MTGKKGPLRGGGVVQTLITVLKGKTQKKIGQGHEKGGGFREWEGIINELL